MKSLFVETILSAETELRNRAVEDLCRSLDLVQIIEECAALDQFRRASTNLYERVRALTLLSYLYRYEIPKRIEAAPGLISHEGYTHLLERRFAEAIDTFLRDQETNGVQDATASALATACQQLALQTLADQVRRSVRTVPGNQWMFRMGHPMDHPLRIRPELMERGQKPHLWPVLKEETPVRMDLSHSCWSDIFFLGMDYPEGARVLNVSIDLAVRGRDKAPRPPIQSFLRIIDEPVLRLTSVDLNASADIDDLNQVFDFGKDYLGLLKAAVIASGIIPPGIEGSGQKLSDLLGRLSRPGLGLEVVSQVNDIPKGSRLAVSTNLLASLIALCMRATGQIKSLVGTMQEDERRLVAARAILGEWLGGSGGGWQDSGGVWPGIKLIQGESAADKDPEWGISRGCLLPRHTVLGVQEVPLESRDRLQQSLVLVHGGMAQNVGPILEMVSEKYLLRAGAEWKARLEAGKILDEIIEALSLGDIRRLGDATTRNFFGPIQTIVPWVTNAFTETLIRRCRDRFGSSFWGFWMLGGMSGGGMGFIFDPKSRHEAQAYLATEMVCVKQSLEKALPFAMDPVVYDFAVNDQGTVAQLQTRQSALISREYYALVLPRLLRMETAALSASRRQELEAFSVVSRSWESYKGVTNALFDRLIPKSDVNGLGRKSLRDLLIENGFDVAQHERIRGDMQAGRTGLAQNRLPVSVHIADVEPGDVAFYQELLARADFTHRGEDLLRSGAVGVVTLAGGVGSRWTQGAGVVKALHPFCRFSGKHRSFLEVHVAKSRQTASKWGIAPPHFITTSNLTESAIESDLLEHRNYFYPGSLQLSPGRSIGLRMVPMERDLLFAWEETAHQKLDEQKQKLRESIHSALVSWAKNAGEGSDYTENLPDQCLHPVGHWFEFGNLLLNGTLREQLKSNPQLNYLLLHNVDTLGANLDPTLLGWHASHGGALSFEVIPRRIDDRGGGLARVDGRVRLVEGLAMPRDDAEFILSYYNTLTTWITLDKILAVFELTREDLWDDQKVATSVRLLAGRMPTYITLKDVKRRWGNGQEDVFPVAQFEKLWGDMTTLPELCCRFAVVPRMRGQQLKDPAQLDSWFRDGSASYVESLAEWG